MDVSQRSASGECALDERARAYISTTASTKPRYFFNKDDSKAISGMQWQEATHQGPLGQCTSRCKQPHQHQQQQMERNNFGTD